MAPGSGPVDSVRRARSRQFLAGVVLIGVGALLLAGQWWPDIKQVIPLVVGLGLLTAFAATREYGWLVGGCIVTGVGVGVILASNSDGDSSGGMFLLSLGTGFLAIYGVGLALRLREHHWWPLIPGGILVTIGALLLAGRQAPRLLEWWPAILIVIGLVVLIQAFIARRDDS